MTTLACRRAPLRGISCLFRFLPWLLWLACFGGFFEVPSWARPISICGVAALYRRVLRKATAPRPPSPCFGSPGRAGGYNALTRKRERASLERGTTKSYRRAIAAKREFRDFGV